MSSQPSLLQTPRSHSLSFYDRCSKSFTSFVAFHWTHSSTSVSLLYWVAQNWMQDLDVASPVLRERITFLDLLKALCLMQSRILLTSSGTPGSFLPASLLVSPHAVLVWQCLPAQVQNLDFSMFNRGACQPIFPVCQCFSEWQHIPLVYQPLPSVLYHLQTCNLSTDEDAQEYWFQYWYSTDNTTFEERIINPCQKSVSLSSSVFKRTLSLFSNIPIKKKKKKLTSYQSRVLYYESTRRDALIFTRILYSSTWHLSLLQRSLK